MTSIMSQKFEMWQTDSQQSDFQALQEIKMHLGVGRPDIAAKIAESRLVNRHAVRAPPVALNA